MILSKILSGALQTLEGLFVTYSSQMSVEAWVMCYRLVILNLLSTNENKIKTLVDDSPNTDVTSWNDTAVLVIEGIYQLFALSLGTLQENKTLKIIWSQIMSHLVRLLYRRSLVVSGSVFKALADMLAEINATPIMAKLQFGHTWEIWRDNNPASTGSDLHEHEDNEKTLVAYLHAIRQLHPLLPGGFDIGQVKDLLQNFYFCITGSVVTVYGSDIHQMTTVQRLVLENLEMIPRQTLDMVLQLVDLVARLVDLAYHQKNDSDQKHNSFVALSKSSMDLLRNTITSSRGVTENLEAVHTITQSLRSLETPIRLKYKFQLQGKEPSTWRKATMTALSLIGAIPIGNLNADAKDLQEMWEAIIDIYDAIAAADCESCDNFSDVWQDQAFDIENITKLQTLIIPALGSASSSSHVPKKYVNSLFHRSLIHEPHPDDLARPDQELLAGLKSTHIGRVNDLPPTPRSKMSYLLLDHLFSLAALHESDTPESEPVQNARITLAKAASPYLILRVGVVLKAYILDQPLRGYMPQPLSQKREMHYILQKVVEMDAQPMAFGEKERIKSEFKRHLYLIYGLVVRALGVTTRDEEMAARLRGALEALGRDFGV